MKLSGTYQLFLNTNTSSTVEVQGNIISSNSASVGGGTVLLLVNGNGSQSINDNQGASISGKLPNIKINKASGTLSLYGSIGMGGSTTLEYVAGTISAGTSRLVCYYSNTLYNNSGGPMTLTKLEFIGSGGTQTVTGKVLVTDTFSTSGSGHCVIDGDTLELQGKMVWNNTSSGSGGNVVYKFSGSSEQFVSGSVTVPLSKVRLHKTSGNITLLTSLSIATDLKFVNGYIVPDTVNWVIFKHGATATGASENSFVKGTVKKIGSGAFVFPVGKDTVYNPIAITATSNSSDAFCAEYFNSQQMLGTTSDTLTYLSECEYWYINRIAGSSSVAVELSWNANSCNIHLLNTLRVARWTGTLWTNLGSVSTTGNSNAGTVKTIASCSSFGYFVIAKNGVQPTANAGVDYVFCQGGSANIGGSPTASGGYSSYTYSWSPSTGLSSSTIANPSASPVDTTLYTLTVTDSDGTNVSDQVLIVVNPKPIVDAGTDTIACYGDGLKFGGDPTCLSGTPPYIYLWQNILGDTLFDVSNPYLDLDTSIILYLSVSDINGCIDIDTVSLTVSNLIHVATTIDTVLFLGQQMNLNPSISGGEGYLTYNWNPGKWLNDTVVENPICHPLSPMNYSLTIEDSLGCKNTTYHHVGYSPLNLSYLFPYAVFSADSIIGGDSSRVYGGVASRFIDTPQVKIRRGFMRSDTLMLNLLEDTLLAVFDAVTLLSADTIDGNLSNITLTSGIYRIEGNAILNGTLTLSGSDSSFFIFDIGGNLTIYDLSEINLTNVDWKRIFFAVNGNILGGDIEAMSAIFLSKGHIHITNFNGPATMLSLGRIRIENSGIHFESADLNGDNTKVACITEYFDPNCWWYSGLAGQILIEVTDNFTGTGFKPKPSKYKLVFDEQFKKLDINVTGENLSDYRWFEWDYQGPADPLGNYYFYSNYPGVNNYEIVDNNALVLHINNSGPFNHYGAYEECKFSVGNISSTERFYHGYFEMKAKLPRGDGVWPAFWMIDGGCPDCQDDSKTSIDKREIDFFDGYVPKNMLPNAQYYHNEPCDGAAIQYLSCFHSANCYNDNVNLADGYHIYAAEWEGDYVTYYVDNIPLGVYSTQITEENVMGCRDQSMYLILGNGVTTPYVDYGFISKIASTANPPSTHNDDFRIEYVKVWQKNGHLTDSYFFNNETRVRNSEFYPGVPFNIATSKLVPGTKYNWTTSDPELVFENTMSQSSYDVWNHEQILIASATGTYQVTLVLNLPQVGNQNALIETQTFSVTIVNPPTAPSFDDTEALISDPNPTTWSIFGVSGATGYEWCFDANGNGATNDGLTLTNSGTSCLIVPNNLGTYKIKVRARYDDDCRYGDWIWQTLNVEDCDPCKVTNTSLEKASISIYPNPSDGYLFLENYSNKSLSVRIEKIDGVTLNHLLLEQGQKTQIDHLPPGVLVAEITDQDGKQLRKMIVIIK